MRRKTIVLIAALAVLTVTAMLALPALRQQWRSYKERVSSRRAEKFFAASQFTNAALCARQALVLNPKNLPACRVLAALAERASAPQMLDWRQRMAEIEPSTENLLQLAAASLKVQPPPCPTAESTLRRLLGEATNSVRYHVLAADLALKQHRPADARFEFAQAARLEPGEPLHLLNIAALDIVSTNGATATAARTTLRNLAEGTNAVSGNAIPPDLVRVALRWLVTDALSRRGLSEAEEFSNRLVSESSVSLEDILQHLSILALQHSPKLDSFLTDAQQRLGTNGRAIKALAGWMVANQLGGRAQTWISALGEQTRSQLEVRLAWADCRIQAGDWPGLARDLESEMWGEAEYMRFALISEANRQQKQQRAADARWGLAVYAAHDRFGPLFDLAGFAARWGREEDRVALLWTMTGRFPEESWPWIELHRSLAGAGDTRGLLKLACARLARSGSDPVARNNVAALSMLLRVDLERAFEMAKQLYQERPDDPLVVSTYAFALYLQKRSSEGASLMQKLPTESSAHHPLALYYAMLLKQTGEPVRARGLLQAVDFGSLLPEEKALFNELKVQLAQTGPGAEG